MFESYHPENVMLFQESVLGVADNSGVVRVKNIKNLPGFFKKSATLADFLIVAVQKKKSKLTLKEKILFGIIVRIRKKLSRPDGSYINFKDNKLVIFYKREKLLGSRIYGPMPFELQSVSLFINNAHLKKFV